MDKLPWELHPELTKERLTKVAGLIYSAREDILKDNEWLVGDCAWGLGCLMYDASRMSISRASQESPWLDIIDPNLHFVFAIGGIPVRFYRGDSDSPNPNSLLIRKPERQGAFEFAHNGVDWFWRIALETDRDGHVTRAVFLQASEAGDTKNHFDIPIEEMVQDGVVPFSSLRREGVDLGAAPVNLKSISETSAPGAINTDDRNY